MYLICGEGISGERFKELTFDMLVSFSALCEREGLRYILDYGSLLGAIRHNGFIPWDDDIDVSMPRADYEKLYLIMERNPELLGCNYRLSSYRNKYSIQKPYHNLIDLRTITVSPNRIRKYYYPVWIDVFPVDYLPESKDESLLLMQRIDGLLKMSQKSFNPGSGILKPLKRMRNMCSRLFLESRLKETDSLASSVKENDGPLTNYMGELGLRDIYQRSFFDDYEYHWFEAGMFRIPKEYDKRLRSIYGNYMEMPPVENRIPHVSKAYWVKDEYRRS